MRVSYPAIICALLAVTSAGSAQAPATAAAPRLRLDPHSPAQAGRTALYKYLDGMAAKDEAARREEIAKITTREQAVMRQQMVRNTVLGLMGGGFERTPLNGKVLGSTEMDGFRIEKVLYESQPGFYVTALLYLPAAKSGGTSPLRQSLDGAPASVAVPGTEAGGMLPAIVVAPGHGATGKATDFAMASTFARNGFAVLSYDPIGQGERLQYGDPAHPEKTLATSSTGEHGEAGLQPTLIGDAVARYFVWDGIRAVDYLLTRPEIDPERIGAFGCSGGGVMTAMLGAADKRVKAIATACYLTTMDALLPSIGPQDGEQSTPGFIAAGFDFADWVELAAPRPYAMIGTVSDMFPWVGFLATAQEARRFYALFDKSAAGSPAPGAPSIADSSSWVGSTPTGPTLNPDTPNMVAPTAPLQVIAGIGGHGNLKPLTSQIVSFFLVNLAHSNAAPVVPPPNGRPQGLKPGDSTSGIGTAEAVPLSNTGTGAPSLPASPAKVGSLPNALLVTPTGQIATSYPGSETVHTLNLKRAAKILPLLPEQTLLQVQTDVRLVTKAEAAPERFGISLGNGGNSLETSGEVVENLHFPSEAGIGFGIWLNYPKAPGRYPATLLLLDAPPSGVDDPDRKPGIDAFDRIHRLATGGNVVLSFAPRPSPPGTEETKSPILGPFYLTELRDELVGKTLLGMRVDDVIRAVDYLASRPDVDPKNITAVASGHMGLVLLHAAVLDPRLKHITIDHVLESYRSLLEAPMPLDAPQDILPGVLLKYDIPDLVRVLRPRVTATDWLPGTANLAGK